MKEVEKNLSWLRAALVVVAALWSLSGTAEEKTPAADKADKIEIYNFSQLVDKAERIVLGEIGERKKDGKVLVTVVETLKAPVRDPKNITPETYKLAEERLKTKPENPKTAGNEPNVFALLVSAEMRLPPAGSQVLFFLWNSESGDDIKLPTYSVKHPQCIYDPSVLPQVRAGIFKPRSISDGRYLRDWDRRAAEKLAQRQADEELRKLKPGEPVLGMKLDAVRPRMALRGDNSFLVTTHLLNVFGKELLVYDGPAGAYGAILTPKGADAEKGIVLRLGGFDGIDPAALNVTSMLDFEMIQGNQLLSREQMFDVKQFPILKTLQGTYTLKVFYINVHDGMKKDRPKEGLENPAWTGTLVSKETELEFVQQK